MSFVGRRGEIARIRERTGGPGPSLLLLRGPRRSGRTSLLRTALRGAEADVLWYQAAPLPDPDHRALLSRRLERFVASSSPTRRNGATEAEDDSGPPNGTADWPELLRTLAESLYVTHRRVVLVLDDWHRLVEARSHILRHLTEFWLEVRRRGIPLHLVLSSVPGPGVEPFHDPENPLERWLDEDIHLGPLPYRDVTTLLAGDAPARDRLALYGVFGGWPEVVRQMDPDTGLEGSLVGSVLTPGAPLLEWGTDMLLREIQAPARYASILRALGAGARSWGEIREGVPDLGSSGQMAPYIQKLEELEIVEVVRSLDAAPGSRSRRYRIVDPFTAFWFRFVLPNRTEVELGEGERVWQERIQPSLDDHLSLVFPQICRQWVEHYGDDVLPARAREVGSLWGSGYDLEVAGTLANGAVFYGNALWGSGPSRAEVADAVGRQVERSRYGFGRERRHRFVFTDVAPHESLRRRARQDELVHVFEPRVLAGD